MSDLGLLAGEHYDHAMEALEDAKHSANKSLRESDLVEALVLSEMAQYAYGKAYAHGQAYVSMSRRRGLQVKDMLAELKRLDDLVGKASHRLQLDVRELLRPGPDPYV
ncbi:MAG TPA: hypothetical protein VJL28_02115 [Gemmatimonadaceae bacterium]|nr:hypothetical protein [Gemmatimonadaceae bacterium]